MEVCLIGAFDARVAGSRPVATGPPSRKARTLLALLAVERGRLVSVDRLAEALWHRQPRSPAADIATLVSRLRAGFGRDVIEGGRAGYRLGPDVKVDLHHAAALLRAAETQADRPRRAHTAASEALGMLASGAVLPDHPDDGWLRPVREWQVTLLRRARLVVAKSAILVGDPSHAIEVAQAAVDADPFDESAYRVLMTASQAAGEPARAVLAFQQLRAVLAGELGIEPAGSTQDLLVTILRDNAARDPAMVRQPPVWTAWSGGRASRSRI